MTSFDLGYEVYKVFVGLKTHFKSPSYDYFKYDGKTTVTEDSFRKNKNKQYFIRLGRNAPIERLAEYFLFNLSQNPNTWIGEVFNPINKRMFEQWKIKIDHLERIFDLDTEKMMLYIIENEIHFDDLFAANLFHPYVMRMMMRNEITVETFILLNEMVEFFSEFDVHLKDDPVWEELKFRCNKYKPFLFLPNGGPVEDIKTYRKLLVDKVKRLDTFDFHKRKNEND